MARRCIHCSPWVEPSSSSTLYPHQHHYEESQRVNARRVRHGSEVGLLARDGVWLDRFETTEELQLLRYLNYQTWKMNTWSIYSCRNKRETRNTKKDFGHSLCNGCVHIFTYSRLYCLLIFMYTSMVCWKNYYCYYLNNLTCGSCEPHLLRLLKGYLTPSLGLLSLSYWVSSCTPSIQVSPLTLHV